MQRELSSHSHKQCFAGKHSPTPAGRIRLCVPRSPVTSTRICRVQQYGQHQHQRSVSVMACVKDLQATPGVCTRPDAATKDFIFQQTMLRIKDPKPALDFYTRVLGMTLLAKLDFPSMSFSLFFLGYEKVEDIPEDPAERAKWMFGRPAILELTHNWGTESDPEFKGYHSGNAEPKGFGHIGLAVPDVYAACKRFEELGVEFVKRPDDGKMKGLAFVKDPDGYWIEILNPAASGALANWQDPPSS